MSSFSQKPVSLKAFRAILPALALILATFVAVATLTPPLMMGQEEGIFVSPDSAYIYKKLDSIEIQLYGRAYPEQALSQRITRVERTLFSNRQPGVLEERYHRILTRMNEDHTSAAEADAKPMLDYLENRLFQETYPHVSIDGRVRRLEGHVFGKTFEKYPMTVRLKKLTYAIPMATGGVRFSATTPVENVEKANTHLPATHPGTVVASTRTLTEDRTRTTSKQPDEVTPRVVSTKKTMPDSWTVSTGDYFMSVYKGGRGEVLRWTQLPVKVYLRNGSAEQKLVFHKALSLWQRHFSLTTVMSSAQADVIVDWENVAGAVGPYTKPIIHMDESRNIRTIVLVNMTPYVKLSADAQMHGMLHQMGHAIGIWGHSEDASDVMYPTEKLELTDVPDKWLRRSVYRLGAVVQPSLKPTQRDINTLTKVYGTNLVADIKSYSPY